MNKEIIDAAKEQYATAGGEVRKVLEELFGKNTFRGKVAEWANTMPLICEALGKNYAEEFAEERMQYFSPTQRAQKEWEMIAEAYNEGVPPDYSNSSEGKYYPYYRYQKGASGRGLSFYAVHCDRASADVGPRQTFRDPAMARLAVERFPQTFHNYYNS